MYPTLKQSKQAVLDGYHREYPEQGPIGCIEKIKNAGQLLDIAKDYKHVVLDGFGVLTNGVMAIDGMAEQLAQLRKLDISLTLLTNGATDQKAAIVKKYNRFGYDFSAEEIISSRDVMLDALAQQNFAKVAVSPSHADLSDFACATEVLIDGIPPSQVDAVVLTSTVQWSEQATQNLCNFLKVNPLPLWCANPDLGAPLREMVTVEPGRITLDIAKETGLSPCFFGKPFASTYRYLFAQRPIATAGQCLMVGDTLHTDILGAKRAGMDTALMVDYGYFATDYGAAMRFMQQTSIFPDFVLSERL